MEEKSISNQLGSSLACSVEQYRGVLEHLMLLSNALTSSDADFQNLVQGFSVKQAVAQRHDETLCALLAKEGDAVTHHPLYLQRLDLIKEVLELNHLLLPKINGMMALVSHELAGLKNGRIVLGGYKQTTHKQGRLIKSSA